MMTIFEEIKNYIPEPFFSILKLLFIYMLLMLLYKYVYKTNISKIEEEKAQGLSPDEEYVPKSFLEKILPFHSIYFNSNDPANLYRNPELEYKIKKNYKSAVIVTTIFFSILLFMLIGGFIFNNF